MSSIRRTVALFARPEFARFVIVGGFAALVNWLSRIGFSFFVDFELAVALAYIVGMTTAYILNKYFVFEQSGRSVSNEYFRFILVNAVAIVQVWLVSVALVRLVAPAIGWTLHTEAIAHAIGVASPIVTSYLGHRFFTYAKKTPRDG